MRKRRGPFDGFDWHEGETDLFGCASSSSGCHCGDRARLLFCYPGRDTLVFFFRNSELTSRNFCEEAFRVFADVFVKGRKCSPSELLVQPFKRHSLSLER